MENFNHVDIKGWFDFADLYSYVVDQIPDDLGEPYQLLEVGTCFGKSACYLGQEIKRRNKNALITCVDIWPNNSVYNAFKNNMIAAGINDIIRPMRTSSYLSSLHFSANYFDFIFIDADHRYEYVKQDIDIWLPKMKSGRIIAGHDYWPTCPGVIKAVNEKFSKTGTLKWGRCWVYRT